MKSQGTNPGQRPFREEVTAVGRPIRALKLKTHPINYPIQLLISGANL